MFNRKINKIKKVFSQSSKYSHEIFPDEIFSDIRQVQSIEEKSEGRIILPLGRNSFVLLCLIFIGLTIVAMGRLLDLQYMKGRDFAKRSATNSLEKTIIFANRGIIFDRNGELLVSNEPPKGVETQKEDEVSPRAKWSTRRYYPSVGLSNVLGYIKYPRIDSNGNLYDTEISGRDGIEEYFDDVLAGKNGTLIQEINVGGSVVSESTINNQKDGVNLTLSLDGRVTSRMYQELKNLATERGYTGGAGIIMDVRTGEILALTSYPEYDAQTMTEGKDKTKIEAYLSDKKNPFLDRATQGLYIPGSIMKPYIAIGALEEKIVDSQKNFLANGQISVPNPYDKTRPTIFRDWKVHGLVDMRRALAVSSNVYFFTIGGGFEGQRGLGIANIDKYMKLFGFGEKTGIEVDGEEEGNIPSPSWKKENFPKDPDWRLGDTYNSSIGQYGYLVTPIQAVRAVATIGNGGLLLRPTILKKGSENESFNKKMSEKILFTERDEGRIIPIAQENLQIIREGMRKGVTEGTAIGLNIPDVRVAAKTGTAELGVSKESVNSWVTGFFPYEKPRYAFAIAMEKGPRSNTVGSTYAMKRLLEWMSIYTPEYLEVD